PFREVNTLSRLAVSWSQIAAYLKSSGPAFLYFVAKEADAKLRARMIFYNGEDPATGSAAGCCVAWAVKYGVLASEQQGLIEQGREVLRPSYIYVRATAKADSVVNVRVGGYVVHVIDGTVTL